MPLTRGTKRRAAAYTPLLIEVEDYGLLLNSIPATLKPSFPHYKQFMKLTIHLKDYENKFLFASTDMDEIWKSHILHTKQYRQFCLAVSPSFIDRDPSCGRGADDAWSILLKIAATKKAYSELFGELCPWDYSQYISDEITIKVRFLHSNGESYDYELQIGRKDWLGEMMGTVK